MKVYPKRIILRKKMIGEINSPIIRKIILTTHRKLSDFLECSINNRQIYQFNLIVSFLFRIIIWMDIYDGFKTKFKLSVFMSYNSKIILRVFIFFFADQKPKSALIDIPINVDIFNFSNLQFSQYFFVLFAQQNQKLTGQHCINNLAIIFIH